MSEVPGVFRWPAAAQVVLPLRGILSRAIPVAPLHGFASDSGGAADHQSLLVDLLDLEDLAVLLLVGLPPLPDLPPPQVDAGTHFPPSHIISAWPIEKDKDWADAVVARDDAARMKDFIVDWLI